MIVPNSDGSFTLDGMADLEEACEALHMTVADDELREFGTVSGFLCHQAGEIPEIGDIILASEYRFTIVDGDERKISSVTAERIVEDDEDSSASDDL